MRPAIGRRLPLVLILAGAVAGYFMLGDWLSFDTLRAHHQALTAFRDAHFVALAAGFVATYFLIVAFSLPGALVASVTGGFLFGLWLGVVLNVTAASLGAFAIFFAARHGLGPVLARRMEMSQGVLKRLGAALREHELSVLFLMRLVPAVPFFAANLLPALAGVKFRNFAISTVFGIIPGALVYTWIGAGLGEVFARGEEPDLSLLWEPYVIGPILGLCALAALPIVIKVLRGRKDI